MKIKRLYFRIITLLFIVFGVSLLEANPAIYRTALPSVIFEALALNRDLSTKQKPKYRSTSELVASPDEKYIYLCEETAKKIAIFDVENSKIVDRIRLPNNVTGCAVSKDGKTLYATCASDIWPNGIVCVVDVGSRKVIKRISVGHSARSPVLSPINENKLYVANLFNNDISEVDLSAGKEIRRIKVVREPYVMDITPDGKTLVVGNALPDDRSTDTDFVSCKISIIDLETYKSDTVRLTRGSHSVLGLTITPDGNYALANHLIGKFNVIGSKVIGGWLHTNNVGLIDLKEKKLINDVTYDFSEQGRANPWGIKCTKDGKYFVTVHSGSNDVSVISLPDFINIAKEYHDMDSCLQNDFSWGLEYRARADLSAATLGPRGVTIIGDFAYTTGYFDSSGVIAKIPITLSLTWKKVQQNLIKLDIPDPPTTMERKGEFNYYSGILCQQQWQSCHSCHPFTRPDALNWILGSSSVASKPRNAKNMLYAWWTPPTTWNGRRGNAYESIIAGIRLEQFIEPTEEQVIPMCEFFKYLKPVASPYLVKGRLSELARKGRELYYNTQKTDCFVCHPAPLFTDNKAWECGVPNQTPDDNEVSFITPHLLECWRTGPYGHVGGLYGIREILEIGAHSPKYQQLDVEEREALISYVLSL